MGKKQNKTKKIIKKIRGQLKSIKDQNKQLTKNACCMWQRSLPQFEWSILLLLFFYLFTLMHVECVNNIHSTIYMHIMRTSPLFIRSFCECVWVFSTIFFIAFLWCFAAESNCMNRNFPPEFCIHRLFSSIIDWVHGKWKYLIEMHLVGEETITATTADEKTIYMFANK